jgi:hypothetical protein
METLTFNGWFRLPTTAAGIKAELEVKVRVFLQQMHHPSLLLLEVFLGLETAANPLCQLNAVSQILSRRNYRCHQMIGPKLAMGVGRMMKERIDLQRI